MRYRTKEKRIPREIPAPTGPEWIAIDNVRLWLPSHKREALRHVPRSSDLSIETRGAEWPVARSALDFILECIYGKSAKFKIDWVTKIGGGLSKTVYRADVTIFEGKGKKYDSFAISQLAYDADPDAGSRLLREQFILDVISRETTYFSIPEPVGMVWYDGNLIAATSFVAGMPVDLRASQSHLNRPWEIVGKIAAEVHKLPIHDLPKTIERYSTRREQTVNTVNNFRKFALPEIQYAVQWICENLPPEKNSVLIHGDLLGQNILWTLEGELFVIDWEYAFIGDPAYELAIVTRGVKEPFQVSNGLGRLIDSYLSSGGQEISKKEVHVYELLLCLGWYEQSLDRSKGGHGPDYYLDFLRSMLRRISNK
jgi:aminoglycoside phosphotransferase